MGNATAAPAAATTALPPTNGSAAAGTTVAAGGAAPAAAATTAAPTAAANASAAFAAQCRNVPTMAGTVRAGSYFNNGSCYVSYYQPNVSYAASSGTCKNVTRKTNATTADCQLLHVTNATLIGTLVNIGVIAVSLPTLYSFMSPSSCKYTDTFFVGLSRNDCNSSWHWDDPSNRTTTIAENSTDGADLPKKGAWCGFNNVIFTLKEGKGALGGAMLNSTSTNAVVCECRTDYGLLVDGIVNGPSGFKDKGEVLSAPKASKDGAASGTPPPISKPPGADFVHANRRDPQYQTLAMLGNEDVFQKKDK
ncbi:hypothetical protein M3Y99_01115500 [Aphelenchoides fujianensis]|nr:hypothetical protein M3Y99_01115500 [Aphelenchoides fujianensis]